MMFYTDERKAPIVLGVMLHVYATAASFEKGSIPHSQARSAALVFLIERGLIRVDVTRACGFASTEIGDEYVKRLLNISVVG